MTRLSNGYRGVKSDIIDWIRSRYPKQYYDSIGRHGELREVSQAQGRFDSEIYGIAERPDGSRYIVEGEKFLELDSQASIQASLQIVESVIEGQEKNVGVMALKKVAKAMRSKLSQDKIVQRRTRGNTSFQYSIKKPAI